MRGRVWLPLRLTLRLVRLLATLFCLELLWRLPGGLLTLCRILRLLELAIARRLTLAVSWLFLLSRISVWILVHCSYPPVITLGTASPAGIGRRR